MYDYIKGTITRKKPTEVSLEAQGVGYHLLISLATFSAIPDEKKDGRLWVHLQVKEDLMQLFGFATQEERSLFRLLISISGVGPKLAITVLSGMGADRLQEAIRDNDVASLTKISGIGRKTAERLVLELREKLKVSVLQSRESSDSRVKDHAIYDDSLSALLALGYKRQQAETAVNKVLEKNSQAPVETVIREALNLVR